MKHVIKKAYINYEKEEKWLNEMSNKGLALVDYSWCRYVFEDCIPGTYIYRLEMLNSVASSTESKNYITFLEDTGVEHIASYMRWVILRKKASEGPFDLFSDLDSKIKHHKKIATFLAPFGILNLAIGSSRIIHGLFQEFDTTQLLPILNLVLGTIISYHVLRHLKKAIKLRSEQKIYDL